MPALAFVALGGGIGALFRYALQTWLNHTVVDFPLGTLVANAMGALAIGLLFPLAASLPEVTRPLVVSGFLGALTTMSSYNMEVVALAGERRYFDAGLHWAGGALLCVILCAGGVWLSGKLFLGE